MPGKVDSLIDALPARGGHFLLESGYHSDLWLTLDALFVDPRRVAPLCAALAERLRPHAMTAVCGPLLGGAFLAQAVAAHLGVHFYYAEPLAQGAAGTLYQARYELPPELRRRARGQRVAVVDDVVSAGSSVRATADALEAAGATVAVVAALLALGDATPRHFAGRGVPVETLGRRDFALWKPEECPLCREGRPLEDPRAQSAGAAAPEVGLD